MKTKICNKCKLDKYFSEYAKNKSSKYGVQAYCKTCVSKYKKEYRKKNRKEILEKDKIYREKNKLMLYSRLKENKDRYREKIRKRKNERYYNDISYRLESNMRSRLNIAIKHGNKSGSTVSLIGCTIDFLKSYLESKFELGMSWENREEFHIDHILPISSFDLSDPEQQKKCFHYTNLQPLWVKDNLKKSSKLDYVKESVDE